MLLGYNAQFRGRPDQADAHFNDAIDIEVPARTHSPNRPLEARRAYLRVCVLWEEYPEYHAKALYLAGNCFLLARDKDFNARARQELQDCIRRYRGSTWAINAQDLLARNR